MAEYDLDGWTVPDLIGPRRRQRDHEEDDAAELNDVMPVDACVALATLAL